MKLSRASRTTLGLAVLAAITSPVAVADDSGWYAGANIGQSRARIDDPRIRAQLLQSGLTATSIVDNNRDTGYKLFGGYRVNKNFALEGGYFNLGRFSYVANTVPIGTLSGNIKLQGVNIDGVGTFPVTEQFSVFGRLGLNYAQARDTFTGTGFVGVLNPNPSKNQVNYKFGAGLQYDFTRSLGMRLEAERYHINDAVGNKGDIDLYSLGLIYRFGVENPVLTPRAVEPTPVVAVPAPVVVPPPAQPPRMKAVFSADSSADSLFDFGKADVKPSGKEAIDKFTTDLKGADFAVITVVGHTDRIGPHAYNMKLSTNRAEAVKAYMVESAGIPADKIEATGVDGSNPVTKPGECKGKKVTRALIACLAPDRRVEVEVVATRTAK
ncbi:MAG: outer membrane beta-barrel protein [Gallionella sp.]|jgi:OOP family OmpA-OmpF porin